MKDIFALASLVLATLLMAVAPAAAHGYVSNPRSRQAFCRDRVVHGCGDVMYEPQSVEAPQGSFECNGNGARFHELNNNALWANHFSLVPPGATHLTFTWTLTAPHRAATWEYFIGQTLLASFNDDGHMPPSSVEHSVSLHGFTGRHTILARWNIYDTINAFYSCVDLDISSHLHNATVLVAGADADASANVPLQQVLAIP